LTFAQIVHAGALDSGDVDKDISAAALGLDEAIALLRIEPFDRTGRHQQKLQLASRPSRECATHRTSIGSEETVDDRRRTQSRNAEPKRVDVPYVVGVDAGRKQSLGIAAALHASARFGAFAIDPGLLRRAPPPAVAA
jgi:hypothetical protein